MKTFILSLFITLTLSASAINHHQIKIIEKIFSEISISTELKIWSDNKKLLSELKKCTKFITVENPKDATMIILEDRDNLSKEVLSKSIFVLNYNLLSKIPKSFGALFWKKGRPNIVIIKPRIETQSIEISQALHPYLEERVW